jgi:hypothetical protein
MTLQLESFPCIATSFMPYAVKKTAYAIGRAVGEDGLAYIVKSNVGDRPVCATEWICNSLAESLNLPVAPSKVLKLPNGELVFGSAEYSHRVPDHELGQLLLTNTRPNDLHVSELSSLLSRIYAFDLFIGNYDRHLNNFLMSFEQSDDRTTRTGNLRLIDFDSADVVTRHSIRLPMAQASNTVRDARSIRKVHQFDNQPVAAMLTQLAKGREFMFERAMYGLPTEWLSANERASLLDRVRSEPFGKQIAQLEQGLGSGTYL